MRNSTVDNVIYSVTGPSLDGMYGIAAIDQVTGDIAVTLHFLAFQSDVEQLVEKLNEKKVPISDFCHAFLNGDFMKLIYYILTLTPILRQLILMNVPLSREPLP